MFVADFVSLFSCFFFLFFFLDWFVISSSLILFLFRLFLLHIWWVQIKRQSRLHHLLTFILVVRISFFLFFYSLRSPLTNSSIFLPSRFFFLLLCNFPSVSICCHFCKIFFFSKTHYLSFLSFFLSSLFYVYL